MNVIVDYCHNAPGMKMLGDFVDRVGDSLESSHELARPSRIGIIATAGDRRDEDMRELGHIAAQHFDVVIVREDVALRGRERGEVAALVSRGRARRRWTRAPAASRSRRSSTRSRRSGTR